MKVLSWNVNGLRSVYKKGFVEWFVKQNADIVCLQEIKAQKIQLVDELIRLNGYYSYFNSAEKKGYSGVCVYSKNKPKYVKKSLGLLRFDKEGRILHLKFKNYDLFNLYIPHGGRQKENYDYKLEVYDRLFKKLKRYRRRNIILVGDFNIARKEIDLARPKQNKNNIMFTAKEREYIQKLMDLGFIDGFRKFNKSGGNYTWWPYMANARQRNLGWRIDYVFVSKPFSSKLKKAYIQNNIMGSDHCPIGIDINII